MPSTQLESVSAAPSEVPAPAQCADTAIETMSQVQEEGDSAGDVSAKEGDIALTDAVASDIAKTETSPVDNNEDKQGPRKFRIHNC